MNIDIEMFESRIPDLQYNPSSARIQGEPALLNAQISTFHFLRDGKIEDAKPALARLFADGKRRGRSVCASAVAKK